MTHLDPALDDQLLAAIPAIVAANRDALDEHGRLSGERMADLVLMAKVRLLKRRAKEAAEQEEAAA